MNRWIFLLALLGISCLQAPSQPPDMPTFNGTWVLQSHNSSEIYTFQHDATQFRVIQRIDDSLGKRTVNVSGVIDGRAYRQKVEGDEFMLRVQWFGDSLIWETRRERASGIFYNRRIMKLVGHDEVRALRTRFLPGPEQSWDETWLRQSEK